MQSFCQPCTLCCLDAEIHWKVLLLRKKMQWSLDRRNFDAEIVELAMDSLCVGVGVCSQTPWDPDTHCLLLCFHHLLEKSWAIAILCLEVTTPSVPTPQSLKRIRTLRLFWTTSWDSSYKLTVTCGKMASVWSWHSAFGVPFYLVLVLGSGFGTGVLFCLLLALGCSGIFWIWILHFVSCTEQILVQTLPCPCILWQQNWLVLPLSSLTGDMVQNKCLHLPFPKLGTQKWPAPFLSHP